MSTPPAPPAAATRGAPTPSEPSGDRSSAARRGFTAWLGQMLSRAALVSFRHPLLTLLGALVVVGLAGWSATRLQVDPDIAELLPPHYESVRDIETLKERFGGVGYVVLLLEGGAAEERRDLARALAPELARLPSVSYVELEKPAAYLREKALWLFDLDDLKELERRVETRYHYEIDRKFLDLDDAAPPAVETADLVERLRRRFEGIDGKPAGAVAHGATGATLPDASVGALTAGTTEDASAPNADASPDASATSTAASPDAAGSSPYFEDEHRLALFVRPAELATNLDFARRVVADVEGVLAGSSARQAHPAVSIELTGRYKKRVDLQEVLGRDLGRTSLLSMGLVAAYLALHFRRPSAVLLLLLPLNAGLVLAYGLAALTFGILNVLTAFLGAILIGIGVDSGIHILGRVHEEMAGGAPLERAVAVAFRDAGRVSLAATLTTAAAFLCLTWTDFRAFREFGFLTAAGVVLVLLSYVVMLPALLRLASRFRWTRPALVSPHLWGTGFLQRGARVLVPALGVLVVLFVALAPRADFDANISRLDDADLPSFRLDREVTRLLGRSQTPLVAFPRDDAEARATAELVRAKMRAAGSDATIGEVATLSEIVPSDLEEKAPHVASIQRMLSRLSSGELRKEIEASLPGLDRVIEAGPPTREDLPDSIRQVLAPTGVAEGGPLVLLYPRVSLGEAEAIRRTAEQVRHLELPSGQVVRTAGEPMVVTDILHLIASDGPRILALTLLLVFAFLRFTLGSFRLATLATVPAVLTLLVTAGILSVLGISLNVLNVIILPILLGIGVDDGAHFVARLEQGEPLPVVWRHTGADVSGAILTDVFGFGVLALASHPGLASLGQVALVGLSVNFVLCVVLLPAVLSLVPLFRSSPLAPPAPAGRASLG